MITKSLKSFVLAGIVSSGLAMSANAAQPQHIDGFSHPESVFVNKDEVYVSNIGEKLEPMAKDNDGFISKLDKNGNVVELKWIANLNAPKGMNVINNTLYIVDIDTLKGFDLKSKKEVLNIPVDGAVFLNDIVVLDNNTLLVSDTGTGIIHQFNLAKKQYQTFAKLDSQYAGPNGLLLDPKKKALIVVGYDPAGKQQGSVVSIDLKSKKVRAITKPLGALDGVAVAKNGDLLVSDWGTDLQGVIYRIDSKGQVSTIKIESMGGPADMYSDEVSLWIPRMVDKKVSKIDLP
ncbi:ATP-binding protein [Helicobacter sp.]|uniref:ATP-binding protein n=1 Tax=Helicobacter sp. TaxID=218 RepID=UPI002A7A5AC7|nr:ATP-binding protein [Helicobacter sp.]MDY2822990.1 ATP-binding protein [Helicobacter sp.]